MKSTAAVSKTYWGVGELDTVGGPSLWSGAILIEDQGSVPGSEQVLGDWCSKSLGAGGADLGDSAGVIVFHSNGEQAVFLEPSSRGCIFSD